MIGKHNDKSSIPACFKHNTDLTHDPDQLSNTYCNFFTNVGLNYANAIPAPKKTFHQTLTKSPAKNPRSMFMSPTDANEIKQIIPSLQPKKRSGHDNPSPYLFKLLAEQISLPIAILTNKSLSEGIVPDEIKNPKIISVCKSKLNFPTIDLYPCYPLFQRCSKRWHIVGLTSFYRKIIYSMRISMVSARNTLHQCRNIPYYRRCKRFRKI